MTNNSRTFETRLRVRYAETDRMGYCYYGNFATYFEVARVEALRELGVTYKQLEDEGIILPVFEFNVKYFKPALYDELLRIETRVTEIRGARLSFQYKTFNERNEQLNEAMTTLVFVDFDTKRPLNPPKELSKLLKEVSNNFG